MRYFPAFHDLSNRPTLVVGGGEAAARKLRLLLKAGARPVVVAPGAGDEIARLAQAGVVTWQARAFGAADIAGCALVISATGLDAVDAVVSAAAQAAGVPVNVVDRADLSSFITPAIIDRDPLVIAISSGADAPLLARQIRARLESLLPANLGRLARFAGAFRGAVAAQIGDGVQRRRFWERFFAGPVAERVLAGDEVGAREAMLGLINRRGLRQYEAGSVAIVGAGPGDPDLLTFKALRRLQEADVVIYDGLAGAEIVDYARRDALRVDVGKSKARPAKTPDEITTLIAGHALAGRRVVHLEGGDPLIFGRGGEALDDLQRRGIAVEVVPGVTTAAGCAVAAPRAIAI